ncbi:MAG TPA: ATP-binding cassette domain-containing protein [Ignavibacteria bacterium]|nr:ATP-binding cassette domain-containing protein [Ignavibacteria bacterium]
MLEIKDLKVSYGSNTVLRGINLTAEEPAVYGVAGLNGSGKTTLFGAISGYIKREEGSIMIDGRKILRGDTGYLMTENYFYSNITGNEYLNIFRQTNDNFSKEKMNELFKIPLDDIIETYSNGMRKKLALLALLKQERRVYLLDEPFNGLDMESCKAVEIVINALKEKGKTVLVSSHILETLTGTCSKIHLLKDGIIHDTFGTGEYDSLKSELFEDFVKTADETIRQSV